MFFVYIVRTNENTLYTGQTNNLEKRIKEHKSKSARSAKYLLRFESVELVYVQKCESRKEAMQRELEIKNWPKVKKEALIRSEGLVGVVSPSM